MQTVLSYYLGLTLQNQRVEYSAIYITLMDLPSLETRVMFFGETFNKQKKTGLHSSQLQRLNTSILKILVNQFHLITLDILT